MIEENKQSRFKSLLRIYKEAKPIWGWLLLSCFLCLLSIVFTVISPKLLGELIQKLYDFWSGELVTENFSGIILAGIIPLGIIYVLLSLVKLANMYLLNNVVSRYFTCNIRIKISEKIKKLPVKFVDCTPVGEILRRMTDDVSHMGVPLAHIAVGSALCRKDIAHASLRVPCVGFKGTVFPLRGIKPPGLVGRHRNTSQHFTEIQHRLNGQEFVAKGVQS
ncbi:MAG: hypothetical protein IIV40_03345, partial [Oscillospiraceae bacterium]|nr:hypothetical protein [Oscillospiraceae bacterium]